MHRVHAFVREPKLLPSCIEAGDNIRHLIGHRIMRKTFWTVPFSAFCLLCCGLSAADDSYRAQMKGLDEQVQEIKSDVLSIDAELRRAYRTDAAGNLLPVNEPIAPFTVNNLGLQIRYRYELGPMSELFLVYARGGYNFSDDDERGVSELFRDMTDVRDADQFLIKFRYKL